MKNGFLSLLLIASLGYAPSYATEPAHSGAGTHSAAETAAVIPSHAPAAKEEKKANTQPGHSSTAAAHAAHHAPTGIPADTALTWLKNGNKRYLNGFLRKDGQSAKDREKLASGQQPHTIVLSCSDSRVPPELVFDQKLGEIFVVRTAGEALDSSAIASIEYAVEHLGSQLILVMGHTSCGAVKAALGTMNGGDAGSPSLNKLVADLHPRLKEFASKAPSEGVKAESWANAKGVAKDLQERSKIVGDKVNAGALKVKVALYHLGSGVVDFQD